MCDIPTEIPQCEPLEEVSRLAFRKIPNPGCLSSTDYNQCPFSIKVGTSKNTFHVNFINGITTYKMVRFLGVFHPGI